jgi:hypothetical protein
LESSLFARVVVCTCSSSKIKQFEQHAVLLANCAPGMRRKLHRSSSDSLETRILTLRGTKVILDVDSDENAEVVANCDYLRFAATDDENPGPATGSARAANTENQLPRQRRLRSISHEVILSSWLTANLQQ